MKSNVLVKRILGAILVLNLFPLIAGLIKADQGETFMKGFWQGYMIDGIMLALIGFILLIVWLFGGFE